LCVPRKIEFIKKIDALLSNGALLVVLQKLVLLALFGNLYAWDKVRLCKHTELQKSGFNKPY
jgi:hypothetical protein